MWGVVMRWTDITGKRFGKLVAVKRVGTGKNYMSIWKCECDCGKTVQVSIACLNNGDTMSCGCLTKERNLATKTTHGGSRSRLYQIWANMKYRCENANCHNFDVYGGRGIQVCKEWNDTFESFREWSMSNGYSDDLSIDRIDNDEGYSPDNCRWANSKTQTNNRRTNRYITYNGESHTLRQWEEKCGLGHGTLSSRLKMGWNIEKVLTVPTKGG